MTLNPQLVLKYIQKMRSYGRKVDVKKAVKIARRFIENKVSKEYTSQIVDLYAAAVWNSGAIQ